MYYPVVAAGKSGNSGGNATSHVISPPAGTHTGRLGIVFFSVDGGSTSCSPSTGWQTVQNNLSANLYIATTANTFVCFWRVFDGGVNDTLTITTPTESAAWVEYLIETWTWWSWLPEANTISSGTENNTASFSMNSGLDASPDPPSENPNWAESYQALWIVAYGWDGNRSHSGYPSGYGSNQYTDRVAASTGAGIAVASTTGDSTTRDPGTGSISASDDWCSVTLAIRRNAIMPIMDWRITGRSGQRARLRR